MTFLTALIALAVALDWIVAILLIRASRIDPRIQSLNERAVLALLLAIFGTLYVIGAANTDANFAVFASEDVRIVIRLALLALALYPARWLALYVRGGFSDE